MKIGIIGAGRVGCSMGRYFREQGLSLAGYFSRRKKSAEEAAVFAKTESFQMLEELVEASDILMIATGDDDISRVWNCIAALPVQGKIVCHFSGSLSSNVFSDRDRLGVSGCSIHPMYAFSDRFTSFQKLNTVMFTLEGDRDALAVIRPMFEKTGNECFVIPSEKKGRYHAAASMMSNMMIGLCDMGLAMLTDCGLDREEALRLTGPLMRGNIDNLLTTSPEAALTGPVERGDVETVRKHLASLREDEKKVYRLLGRELVKIARRKNPERDYGEINRILEEEQ